LKLSPSEAPSCVGVHFPSLQIKSTHRENIAVACCSPSISCQCLQKQDHSPHTQIKAAANPSTRAGTSWLAPGLRTLLCSSVLLRAGLHLAGCFLLQVACCRQRLTPDLLLSLPSRAAATRRDTHLHRTHRGNEQQQSAVGRVRPRLPSLPSTRHRVRTNAWSRHALSLGAGRPPPAQQQQQPKPAP